MIDRQQLVEAVVSAFPSVEADIRDETWAGLVHLEASSFARYTQQQIESGNRSELRRCFELAKQLLLDGDDDVKNAMAASYLEHLNLQDQKRRRSWALAEMPEPLRHEYEALHREDDA